MFAMMKLLSLTFLLPSATDAMAIPRQETGGCCFKLRSVGVVNETVNESHIGELILGGTFQQGGFCLDTTTKTIKDGLNHNCFMRAPFHQFECYAGALGTTAFFITPPKEDGTSYLTFDNGSGTFYACPVDSGADPYYDIFSQERANKANCYPVSLALQGQTPECSASQAIPSPSSRIAHPTDTNTIRKIIPQTPQIQSYTQTVVFDPKFSLLTTVISTIPTAAYSHIYQAGVFLSVSSTRTHSIHASSTTTSPSKTATPSRICSVSPSAPSAAPIRVGSPDNSKPGDVTDVLGEVRISSLSSAIFEYNIPNTFLPTIIGADTPLCALQFRMPVCTMLPTGYPCYRFSGLEQEVLSNSGMHFNLTSDDEDAAWNNKALHQVFPGENSVLGTFPCGRVAGSYAVGRKMIWQVSSVRNFSLEFLHAGVGANATYADGIGAWIVPCQ